MTDETQRPSPTDRPDPEARPTGALPGKADPATPEAESADSQAESPAETPDQLPKPPKQKPGEVGGPEGPEPTRYGDWEVGGRCTDF